MTLRVGKFVNVYILFYNFRSTHKTQAEGGRGGAEETPATPAENPGEPRPTVVEYSVKITII